MADDGQVVVITLRDIYDKLTVVDQSVQDMKAPVETVADHETRIRGLERWRYGQPVTIVISLSALILDLRK